MKCVACGNDAKLKDRANGRCPSCDVRFVFHPERGEPFTDVAFAEAVKRVSGHGAVRWTQEHLRHELLRRLTAKQHPGLRRGAGLLFLAIGVGLAVAGAVSGAVTLAWVGMGPAAIGAALRAWPSTRAVIEPRDLSSWWARWVDVHPDAKATLLLPVRSERPRRAPPEDLEAYGFDRAVVCQHAATVDLLVSNQFHVEHNAAIFTLDGHPASVWPTLKQMLAQSPDLVLFVLHDASADGLAVVERAKLAFPGQRVVDAGLDEEGAKRFEASWVPTKAPVSGWYAAWACPIEALPPEQLLRGLYRVIVQTESGGSASADGSTAGLLVIPGPVSGGADSFG